MGNRTGLMATPPREEPGNPAYFFSLKPTSLLTETYQAVA